MLTLRALFIYYFIGIYIPIFATPTDSVPTRKATNHIIFDLGGVLIDTHMPTFLWHLGIKQLTMYSLSTVKSPHALRQTLYMVMNSLERTYARIPLSYDDEGRVFPSLMHDWLSGKQTSKQIFTKLTYAIAHHPEWFANATEQEIMHNLVEILFTPNKFAATRMFNQQGIDLVKWCKEQEFNVYVLSNWDSESFKILHAHNRAVFDLFDGIIISGDHNCLKPSMALYHILFSTFNIDPHDCVMIDDRIENIHTARALGIHGIHYISSTAYPEGYHDFKAIEKEIREWARYKEKYI